MNILYYNNCWFTNVGEAFIDIGAMELIKRLFKNAKIINISNMSKIYLGCLQNDSNKKLLDMSKYFSADYLIFSGMFGTEDFLNCETYTMAKKLCEQGTKIIFLGLGQCKYSDRETELCIEYFKELNIELIVSRDKVVYNNFKDYFHVVNGIDCAFWVKDTYDPRTEDRKMYDIVAYNRGRKREIPKTNKDIVTAYHFQYFLKPEYVKDNMLISDTPYDYLTLYSNADNVYTDLVHATIISLSYERHVMFDRTDNRSYAIDALDDIR